MKRIRKLSVLLLSLALILCPMLTSCRTVNAGRYTFRYQSGAQDEESYLYYTDNFFSHPSTEYDPSLATASLSLAMASFASIDDFSYAHRYINGEKLLKRMGFKEVEANEFFQEKPGTDTLGVMVAQKKLGDATLLAVCLRGANYESEWASNFTIGTGEDTEGHHQGFYEASDIILTMLMDYVFNHDLSGKLKIWISGYSRAGAACNIASGRIDQYIDDKVNFLGDDVTLAREDFYAYCFEAPQGVSYDETNYPRSALFNNIFCIVNPNDPVPKTAMTALGFTRYGIDIILPTTISDLYFEKDLEKIEKQLNNLRSFGDWGTYELDDFNLVNFTSLKKGFLDPDVHVKNWAPGLYLDDLLTTWIQLGIKDRENYVENLQSGLRDLLHLAYLRKNTSSTVKDLALQFVREVLLTDEAAVITDDLIRNQSRLSRDIEVVLHRALLTMGLNADVKVIERAVLDLANSLLSAVITKLYLFQSLLSKDNLHAFGCAHRPELCLAYLRAMDPFYTDSPVSVPFDGRYYVITAPQGTAIKVQNYGNTVASIKDDIPADTDYLVPHGLIGSELKVVLPAHEAYQVTLSSTEEVSLVLVTPGLLEEIELPITAEKTAEGYAFEIDPAGIMY